MDEAGAAESTGIIGSRVADKRCADTKRILLFPLDVRPALFKGFKQAKCIYVIYLRLLFLCSLTFLNSDFYSKTIFPCFQQPSNLNFKVKFYFLFHSSSLSFKLGSVLWFVESIWESLKINWSFPEMFAPLQKLIDELFKLGWVEILKC